MDYIYSVKPKNVSYTQLIGIVNVSIFFFYMNLLFSLLINITRLPSICVQWVQSNCLTKEIPTHATFPLFPHALKRKNNKKKNRQEMNLLRIGS